MRKIFAGFKPGDICTGTVHRFGLQSTILVKAGIISPTSFNPITDGGRILVQATEEWQFNGLQR
jgi:hypothetical protein